MTEGERGCRKSRKSKDYGALALTSRKAAALRALSKRLDDPLADKLAGDDVMATAREARQSLLRREGPGVECNVDAGVPLRHFWIEKQIEKIREGAKPPKQVVVVGAGMDTKAYRLECLQDASVFEVDQEEVLSYKAHIIAQVDPAPRLVASSLEAIPAIFSSECPGQWMSDLLRSTFDPTQATIWVVEGVLHYLTEQEVCSLMELILANTGHASYVLADMVNAATLPQASEVLPGESWGIPLFQFGTDSPEDFLGSMKGISDVVVAQAGEDGANFGFLDLEQPPHGRWKLSKWSCQYPREVTVDEEGRSIKRMFLVQAQLNGSRHSPTAAGG